jgi:hypothetical protein
MKIGVNAETSVYTVREPDPTDSWDNGDTAGCVENVSAYVTDNPEGDMYSYIIKDLPVSPGKKVWAVVVDYESGSTFGRDGGYAQVLDVFAEEWQAYALRQVALAHGNGSRLTYDGKEYHASWLGYFESLQSIDVWELVVRDTPQNLLTPAEERTFGEKKYGK